MEITLELVERLKKKADVTYAQAKQALEYSGGNLLDALIYLEEQGTIPREEGAYFSTRNDVPPPPSSPQETLIPLQAKKEKKKWRNRGKEDAALKEDRKGIFHTLRRWLIDNELEIWHRDKPITALPVLILILLLFFAPWITLPALIVGLFLGFRYRFSGPDLERDDLNKVMGTVADTAADLGRQVMDELKIQQEKHQGKDGKQP